MACLCIWFECFLFFVCPRPLLYRPMKTMKAAKAMKAGRKKRRRHEDHDEKGERRDCHGRWKVANRKGRARVQGDRDIAEWRHLEAVAVRRRGLRKHSVDWAYSGLPPQLVEKMFSRRMCILTLEWEKMYITLMWILTNVIGNFEELQHLPHIKKTSNWTEIWTRQPPTPSRIPLFNPLPLRFHFPFSLSHSHPHLLPFINRLFQMPKLRKCGTPKVWTIVCQSNLLRISKYICSSSSVKKEFVWEVSRWRPSTRLLGFWRRWLMSGYFRLTCPCTCRTPSTPRHRRRRLFYCFERSKASVPFGSRREIFWWFSLPAVQRWTRRSSTKLWWSCTASTPSTSLFRSCSWRTTTYMRARTQPRSAWDSHGQLADKNNWVKAVSVNGRRPCFYYRTFTAK